MVLFDTSKTKIEAGRQATLPLTVDWATQTSRKAGPADPCRLTLDDASCVMWQSVVTNDRKDGVGKVA